VAADTGATGPSLSSLLVDATQRLGVSGVPSPAHDALALLAHALGWDTGECRIAVARGDAVLAGFDAAGWERLIERRAAREPLQHLLGRAAFRGIELEVGPGVFVPRPETEVVAGEAIDAVNTIARDRGADVSEESGVAVEVVDLCAGSGAIGIAVAAEVPAARVTLVEMSREAFAYLERNVAAQPEDVRRRLTTLRGDARTVLADRTGTVDVVVSNPPYVPHGAVPRDPEVAIHDPEIALYGLGTDGLEVPRGVAAAAARLLHPGGTFVMEHGDDQGEAVRSILEGQGAWRDIDSRQDLTERDRFVVATRT
jgi:release factor glutamine methyltransferase